ncbi:hypothetical protein [Aliarcobacter cryaerophilus]|uniref:hypothetical protein n=1 Tax=Aliarcobacter cryaerophilus TaxID=28198 RepID=UPI0021B656BF|nr:hypothetical protein [Aliarcobacter cryaerophilus]MCT7497471.1 hypothetical protein [Aliarcobacter cryaerophilus]
MSNYYQNKFDDLKLKYEISEAINDICNLYLDNKPKKLEKYEKTNQFWYFIKNIKFIENINNHILTLSLIKGIKEQYIFSNDFLELIFQKDKKILIQAIKYSKIFLNSNEKNFINIKNFYLSKNIYLDFFKATDILYNKYNILKNKVNNEIIRLKSFAYFDLIFYMSLYTMKQTNKYYTLTEYENTGDILTKILHDRLKEPDKKRSDYKFEESGIRIVDLLSKNKYNDGLQRLETIINIYKELYLFENTIIATFCFDDNFQFEIINEELNLKVIDINKYKKWSNENRKLDLFFEYYFSEAIYHTKELLDKHILGTIENNDINKFAFNLSLGIDNLLEAIYGCDNQLKINDALSIPKNKTIETICFLSSLYRKDYVAEYISLLEKYQWQDALNIFVSNGMDEMKQRFPILIQQQYTFANNMNNVSQASITELDRNNIESFYTFDLKKFNNIHEEKLPNIFEKPLLKLDDLVLIMPFVLGSQNPFTSIINNLLNVHFKRTKYRKEEVQQSENYLLKLFQKLNFKAITNYELPFSKDYDLGDIDLICTKDDYLFVLELKSTYIRTSFENIWNYKSNVLRKASSQLNKRKRLIDMLIKDNNQEFNELFGVPKNIVYLIIDTSFEFDHEMFDKNLKISMFELINLLNGDNKEFYPNGFSTEIFLQNINNEKYWQTYIDNNIEEISYKIS